jgi:hypothetical protein
MATIRFATGPRGFLKGSQAEEESLARSSALHASLLRAGEFYERHRGLPSLLYSDAMILSPNLSFAKMMARSWRSRGRLRSSRARPPTPGLCWTTAPRSCRKFLRCSGGGPSMCSHWRHRGDTRILYWGRGAVASSAMIRESWRRRSRAISEMAPGLVVSSASYFRSWMFRPVEKQLQHSSAPWARTNSFGCGDFCARARPIVLAPPRVRTFATSSMAITGCCFSLESRGQSSVAHVFVEQ